MIKIDIVKRVADRLSLKDREALMVVDTIIDSIKETIHEYGRIEIRNFGVFHIKTRKPRTGRNPRNKKEYPILPRKVVTFKLGKQLKDFSVKPEANAGEPGTNTKPDSRDTQTSYEQDTFLPEDK